jgi:hypothetical protein
VAGARLVSARRAVLVLFVVGLALLAAGAALFILQFPHAPDDFGWFAYADDTQADPFADWSMGWPGSEGDVRLSLAGAAIAGAGFLVILVPIIAWGVRSGRMQSDAERT